MKAFRLREYVDRCKDDRFDLMFPPEIRELSRVHWTPVSVARQAAEFLVRRPGTKVLDVGCGPGKFCMVGALMTDGVFTGIEQRRHLCELAMARIRQVGLHNANILHGNVAHLDFSGFDAFYLFNPFEENLEESLKIDGSVPLSAALFDHYAEHVARELTKAPLGTRVVTYCGECGEVPVGYECVATSRDFSLTFCEKTRQIPIRPAQESPLSKSWWRRMVDSA